MGRQRRVGRRAAVYPVGQIELWKRRKEGHRDLGPAQIDPAAITSQPAAVPRPLTPPCMGIEPPRHDVEFGAEAKTRNPHTDPHREVLVVDLSAGGAFIPHGSREPIAEQDHGLLR